MKEKYADYVGQPSQSLKTWKAALYIRLSKEDMEGNQSESASVANQREILLEYLKLHPDIELYDIYIDDGWSGTRFERPSWSRLMKDAHAGNVNCVIVKDLARFGRNYTDGGKLLEDEFVRLRIRFISLNNGIDTVYDNMNAATRCISIGVTNVINESVAATTSVNVRGTLNCNRKQGKFIGSFPSYGYLKDPNDYHKLIIDEEVAPIIRMIYKKFIDGEGIISIAKDLNEMGIPNPSMYKQLKGWNYKHPTGKNNDGLWQDSSVRRILQHEMYIGNMVQGRNTTISYKIKECRAIPKEEWIVVENTHEGIIDRETFDKAQSLFRRSIRKPPQKKEVDLFAGLVRCADCFRIMNKKTNTHSYGTYHYYRCVTARKMHKSACTNHTIRIDKLEEAVLAYVQTMVKVAVEFDETIKAINNSSKRKQETDHLKKTLQIHEKEREKCMKMQLDLYPDWKSGAITQEEYMLLKAKISERVIALDEMIANLKRTEQEYSRNVSDENAFITHFKKYHGIEKLTRPMLVELIDAIYVHEGGRINVKIKQGDAFEKVLDYIEEHRAKEKLA